MLISGLAYKNTSLKCSVGLRFNTLHLMLIIMHHIELEYLIELLGMIFSLEFLCLGGLDFLQINPCPTDL